ncbi:chaplin [Streptomyces sp. HMX112]|uniref:chaplin n=1 Tax=Streptomyces sp. HMX112 TaxID=3390850 RepID=UPI003A7F8726
MSRVPRSVFMSVMAGAAVMGAASVASADSGAEAVAAHSPGVLSGDVVQVPVHVPVNVCGNSVNVIGLLNPTSGNACVNHWTGW